MDGSFRTVTELITDKLSAWYEYVVALVPNFVIALFVLVLFYLLGAIVSRAVRNVLNRVLKNVSLVNFLSALARLTAILIGLIIALYALRLDKAVLSLLTGVGIVGIALGFAFQDMAANFISGIALVFRDDRPFKVGDIVETNEHLGSVAEINMRTTTIQTFQGQWVFIPNKLIFQEPVINFSMLGKRRIDLSVGISYGDNLEKVRRVTLEAVESIPNLLPQAPVEFYYEEFGDSSINFIAQFWIAYGKEADFLRARSEAVLRIKKAYDTNGITIPFPIRTLDFGIKGGKTLAEMPVQIEKST